MNYTQSIGNIVELQCISKFIELGYEVSIPYGNGAKYGVSDNTIRKWCIAENLPHKKTDIKMYTDEE